MQNTFTAGAIVRLKNATDAKTGTIEKIADGFAHVRYDHKPGVNTNGYYPLAHLELVKPAPATPPAAEPKPAVPAEATKPKATTKDVLGNIPAVHRV